MSTLRCVVLDIDDTLYLERDYVRSGFDAVGRWVEAELGLPRFSETAWRCFEAGHRGDIFDRALDALGCPTSPTLIEELVQTYRGHRPDILLLEDAAALLADIQGAGLRLAVITDGPAESQRRKVETLGLESLAHPVVVTGERGDGWSKTYPRPFELVERLLGLAGPELVYLGDDPEKDFRVPAARGWHTIRVRRLGSLHQAVASGPEVRHEVDRLDGLMSYLLTL